MEKLKTLKDIESFGEYTELVGREKLKQEAIKWVKAIDKGKIEYGDPFCCDPSVKGFIINFFNITEADLQ